MNRVNLPQWSRQQSVASEAVDAEPPEPWIHTPGPRPAPICLSGRDVKVSWSETVRGKPGELISASVAGRG
jgi:hypothetical protein